MPAPAPFRPVRLPRPAGTQRGEAFFARHAHRAVFFERFLAGIRFLAGPPAGIARTAFPRFLIWNAAGAAVYVSAVAAVGYVGAGQLRRVLGAIHRAEHVLALGAGLLLAWLAWRFLRRAGG